MHTDLPCIDLPPPYHLLTFPNLHRSLSHIYSFHFILHPTKINQNDLCECGFGAVHQNLAGLACVYNQRQ